MKYVEIREYKFRELPLDILAVLLYFIVCFFRKYQVNYSLVHATFKFNRDK